jgi:hypothetical protein
MWNKILILIVVFFLVANPATFKIMRGLLGGWVASAEGLATPAGLILHALVFVGLAIFLPKALMGSSGFITPRARYLQARAAAEKARSQALRRESKLRSEGLSTYVEDGEEEYADEAEEEYEDEDGEGYLVKPMLTWTQRAEAEERRAAMYAARADKAKAKLVAEGVPVPK